MKDRTHSEKEEFIINKSSEIVDALIKLLNELKQELHSSENQKKIFAITCIGVIDDYFVGGKKPQFHVDIEKRNAEYLIELDRHVKEKGIH